MSRLVVLSALLAAVVAVGSGSPAPPKAPASNFFLKIEGIEGETADGGIALTGFAWDTKAEVGRFAESPPAGIAVEDSGAGGPKTVKREGVRAPREAASGQATGRRMHKPLTIVKELDKASPKLMEACAKGTPLGDVEVWSSEGGQQTLRYTLQEAIITSYGIQRPPDASAPPTESVSFNFAKIEMAAPAGPAEAINLNSSKSN